MKVALFQVATVVIGGRRLLVVLLPCVAFNQYWWCLVCLSRATVGVDRICSLWRSAGLPEKEPRIKWYLLQRPGYQTTNKSYFSAADEVCLANRRWNVLFVIDTSEWCNHSFSNIVRGKGHTHYTSLIVDSWTPHSLGCHVIPCQLSLNSLNGVFQKKHLRFVEGYPSRSFSS